MEVVTRSRPKKRTAADIDAERMKVAELWKQWVNDRAVLDEAFEIYWTQGHSKRCPESSHLVGHLLIFAAKKEWKTMVDTDKAPFILKALLRLFYAALAWEKYCKNAKPKKKSKGRKKSDRRICGNEQAQSFFCRDILERYIIDNPDCSKIPSEVINAAQSRWGTITNEERAAYVKLIKERYMERERVYKLLLSDRETYILLEVFGYYK